MADGSPPSLTDTRRDQMFPVLKPNTGWLKQCAVQVDDKGFVQTGGKPPAQPGRRAGAACAPRNQPARRVRHRRYSRGFGEARVRLSSSLPAVPNESGRPLDRRSDYHFREPSL
jgi:hypothetical protein